MKEKEFRELLEKRDLDETQIESAFEAVRVFEAELKGEGKALESTSLEDLKGHLARLISREENTYDRLVALARYFYATGRSDLYIYFTAVIGGLSVLPSISERLGELVDEETRDRVFDGVERPPLGSPPGTIPRVTSLLMERLQAELPPDVYRRVLAGNHHRIPLGSFDGLKKLYEESENVDEFLKKRHGKAVAELEEFLAEGKVWYEQEITPRVVEFVKSNQEVLGGVRRGDRIYWTKIPYDPDAYLGTEDPLMKRYYTCHCPLARASILDDGPRVPMEWCYCSGGYGKLPFEVVFGEELEVELLESVLDGDPRCRFAIKIPSGVQGPV